MEYLYQIFYTNVHIEYLFRILIWNTLVRIIYISMKNYVVPSNGIFISNILYKFSYGSFLKFTIKFTNFLHINMLIPPIVDSYRIFVTNIYMEFLFRNLISNI